jgi:hypothetical protein
MAFPTLMVQPLDESQGSSPLQGRGSWLMCEVALSLPHMHPLQRGKGKAPILVCCYMIHWDYDWSLNSGFNSIVGLPM